MSLPASVVRGLWLVLAALWASAAPAAQFTIVSGKVSDAESGLPLAHAQIQISRRQVELLPNGLHRLKSIDQCQLIATAFTDDLGNFRVEIESVDSQALCKIHCWRAGHIDSVNALAGIVAHEQNWFEFRLSPEPRDENVAESFQPLSSLDSSGAVSMAAVGTDPLAGLPPLTESFSVPEEVFVSNLEGNGFTGLMNLDEFVAGVVTAEEGDGFPFEALKAQAVAARTFALHRLQTRGQANGGQAYSATLGAKSRAAAANTSRVVLLFDHGLIPAYYAARCNGDFTLNSEDGPSLAVCEIGALNAGVVSWARAVACSGHPNCSQTGEPCCQLLIGGRTNFIYGHGVGMCQRGAQEFAGRDGWNWTTILTHYYTGVTLANLPGLAPGDEVITGASVNVRALPCGPSLLVAAAGSGAIVLGESVSVPCALASPYNYLSWREVLFADGKQGWVAEDYLRRIDSPASVQAVIDSQPQNFGINVDGGGTLRAPQTFQWRFGSSHTLEAIPEAGFAFGYWIGSGTGSYSGLDNPAHVTALAAINERAVFTPLPLFLRVELSAQDVRLRWPATQPPWRLERTESLTPPIDWRMSTETPVFTEGAFQMTQPRSRPAAFFRLRAP